MEGPIKAIISSGLWALILKEAREILRNKYLLFLLLVPPTVQLLILGGALNPQVHNLNLAIVDHCNSQQSHRLVDFLSNNGTFKKSSYVANEQTITTLLERGKLNVGLIIPPNFTTDLAKGQPANIQILIDGTDAYTAGIASSYVLETIQHYQPKFSTDNSLVASANSASQNKPETATEAESIIDPHINILYNPGQISSWYFVPGILGACLTLTGTLVSSATILRERESGTMEQLLMTPASTWEILLAKIIPLVVFLLGDVCMAIGSARIVFGMPFCGNLLLFMIASAFYAFVGIGLGMLLGSICASQRQSQLASFFINIPLILLSGTVVPLDTMPWVLQALSFVDPLRYYTFIARGIILKGATFEMLWQQLAILALSAILVLSISANRFRRQLV